jgi:iron complex transport system permease protein
MTVSRDIRASKICSFCDASFDCHEGGPGCWCESIVLTRDTLAELRALSEDCVCADCLQDLAEAPASDAPGSKVRARGLQPRWLVAASVLLVTAVVVGLCTGPVAIAPGSIARSALRWLPWIHVRAGLTSVQSTIVWKLRAPRVVLAGLVGAMLACAGTAYQGVFRNPLADPYLLGVAAGAGLGATIAISYASAQKGGGELLPLAAFVGAVAAVTLAYALGHTTGAVRSTGSLILAGVTVAAFLTAAQTYVQQRHAESFRDVYAWLLGGFASAEWRWVFVVLPYCVVSSVIIIAHRRVLDVLSVGDDEAASLGINVRRTRLVLVMAATAGTAAAVSVSGLIGFVGIIVPHTVRLLVSSSYRVIVPLSLILGAAFLVFADVVARSVLSPSELPIGVVTAFCGAPFFAVVLRRSQRAGW